MILNLQPADLLSNAEAQAHTSSSTNEGSILVTLNIRCRKIIYTRRKEPMILETTHIPKH